MVPILLVTLLADLATSMPPIAQVETPQHVRVESSHTGFGGSRETLDISRGPHGFSDGSRAIDEQRLKALVAAASAPALPALDARRLTVDAALLRAAWQGYGAGYPPRTTQRFLDRLADPRERPAIVQATFDSAHSDDYPAVSVELTLRSGDRITIASDAQQPFMLPWRITRHGQTTTTYDPDLGRAIAALLPEKFINRDRLTGGSRFADELVLAAMSVWHDELETAGADEKYGRELAPLQKRFRIERQEIGSMSGFNSNMDEVWDGRLLGKDPSPIDFELCLSARDKIAGVEPFLRDADALSRRVRALPWVARYLAAHPDARAVIQYRDDQSISPKTQETIVRNLKQSHAALATEIAPLLERSIGLYLELHDRFAIFVVLPDGRSVVNLASPPPSDLPDVAAGGVILPDGTIAR